ncbi:MAG: TlpA disulfide reductase family protein [Bacteroidota bacterium]
MKMIKVTLLLGFALFASTLTAQTKTLPDLSVKTLQGESKDLAVLSDNGKIKVISFWATWCAPCKKELDAIAEIYEDWQENYDMELIAISIDTRRALATVPGMVAAKGWEYNILTAEQTEAQNAFNFQTIPQTFLVDQAGNVVYHHNGYVPGDEYELEDKIKALAEK